MSSTGESRKRRPGRPKDATLAARRRKEIVRHAIDHFSRNGYTGADLDAIAADVGCSKGTLYNYFASKGDLFSATVDHVMFGVVEAIRATDDGDPLEQFERLVRAFLQHFAENPEHVEILIQERSDFRDRSEPSYYRYRETSQRAWHSRARRLMDDGRMRTMPPERVMNVIIDALYGTIFLNHFRRRVARPEQQAEEILDVVFGGLLTESGLKRWNRDRRRESETDR